MMSKLVYLLTSDGVSCASAISKYLSGDIGDLAAREALSSPGGVLLLLARSLHSLQEEARPVPVDTLRLARTAGMVS